MQKFLYFCAVKSIIALILLVANLSLDEVVMDIFNAATELGEVDYEQLQSDLYALNANPIDLNNTSDEELQQLYFLSPRQIDDILAYADKHPFESVYELRLIPSLADYEIRNLVPFVRVSARTPEHNNMYAREVFTQAKHEIITRVDARNIEAFEGTDPVYAQLRYRFDYKRKVLFGGQLRRPVGGGRPAVRHLYATHGHRATRAHNRRRQLSGFVRSRLGHRAGLPFRQIDVHSLSGPAEERFAVLLVGGWRRSAWRRRHFSLGMGQADAPGCQRTLFAEQIQGYDLAPRRRSQYHIEAQEVRSPTHRHRAYLFG